MDVKYSVIVPIYGVESYINVCINSLIQQKYANFEIILVDDGSYDNCPRICDEYKKIDKRITVVHKENGGLVSARQAGAQIAKGDYIMCVDGDDWVSEDYISVINSVVEKYNPDIVCFDAEKVNEFGVHLGSVASAKCGYFDKEQIRKEIFPYLIEDKEGRSFPPSIWSKVYRRDLYVYSQMSLSTRINIGEDYACTKVVLSKASSMVVIDNILYYYRINNSSMTKNHKPFDFAVPELIGRHFENNIDLDNNDFQEQIFRCVTHLLFNTCSSAFYENKDYKSIKKNISSILSNEYYVNVINNCKYDSKYVRGRLALLTLKRRQYWLMRLYADIKKLW